MDILQLFISGTANGCVYGLIALGFVLIYKATEAVNFAQGDFMMLGAFITLGFTNADYMGFPFWISCLLAIAIMASYVLSFVFLEKAVQGIPLGIAYSIWTGIGVVGAFAFAAFFHDEKPTSLQAMFAAIVLIGLVGLYATTRTPDKRTAVVESAVSRTENDVG